MASQLSRILLERYQSADADAAFEIHARYAHRLLKLAKSRIGNRLQSKADAEDIVQTTLLAFFKKADNDDVFWREEGDLWRLLSAICINHVKREAEHHAAAKRNVEREQGELNLEPEFEPESQLLEELLEPLLKNESPLVTEIIRGRLEGRTHHEIAAICNRSERTIRRMLQMIKAKLAQNSELNLVPLSNHLREAVGDSHPVFSADYFNFDLLRMLSAGSFGKVYLARDRTLDQLVAVKALRRSWLGDAKAESLFLQEAKILSTINHPHVIQFLGAGPLPNGSWFIVLELAEGQTLLHAIEQANCEISVRNWLAEICSGLAALHSKGVAHGDLKPTNIVVAEGGAKLIDFGFSRLAAEAQDYSGGTEGYAAPERKTNDAADVYALGKIFKAVAKSYPRIAEHLLPISERCTATNPDDRPSVAEVIQDIV